MTEPTTGAVRMVLVVASDVTVVWADGHESYFPGVDLRRACSCASCKGEQLLFGKRTLPTVEECGEEAFRPVAARLVGNYGLKVVWADGHDHGIYVLADLRRACPCEQCAVGREVSPSGEAP